MDDYRNVKNLSEYQLYLFSDYYLSGRDEKIKSLAEKAAGGEQGTVKTARKLYEFTKNYLTYGNPIKGLYGFKDAMVKREVDCGGFASFWVRFAWPKAFLRGSSPVFGRLIAIITAVSHRCTLGLSL